MSLSQRSSEASLPAVPTPYQIKITASAPLYGAHVRRAKPATRSASTLPSCFSSPFFQNCRHGFCDSISNRSIAAISFRRFFPSAPRHLRSAKSSPWRIALALHHQSAPSPPAPSSSLPKSALVCFHLPHGTYWRCGPRNAAAPTQAYPQASILIQGGNILSHPS